MERIMSEQITKGKVTISCRSSTKSGRRIGIEIMDEDSGALVCDLELTPEAFGEAVTGLARQGGRLRWDPDHLKVLGMVREHKTEQIEVPKGIDRDNVKTNEELAKNMKHMTDEGWRPRWDDFTNHNRSSHEDGKRFARVSFERHVPKEPEDV